MIKMKAFQNNDCMFLKITIIIRVFLTHSARFSNSHRIWKDCSSKVWRFILTLFILKSLTLNLSRLTAVHFCNKWKSIFYCPTVIIFCHILLVQKKYANIFSIIEWKIVICFLLIVKINLLINLPNENIKVSLILYQ